MHVLADSVDTAAAAQPRHVAGATRGRGLPVSEGNAGRVLQAAAQAVRAGANATLAVVLETEGSTYTSTGTLALFADGGHVGWLSGGCLEPEIERRAAAVGSSGQIGWLEIDTRDDDAVLSGAAIGCRGRQRLALLPLRGLPGSDAVFDAWLGGHRDFILTIGADGLVDIAMASLHRRWRLPALALDWPAAAELWSLSVLRPPEVLILGAGPEATTLVPLLRNLGWRTTIVERRPRWRDGAAIGAVVDASPAQALVSERDPDAVLVMHHNFELDREALEALAASPVPFIGLLGPVRRQQDLFKVLPPAQRAALLPRLRSPVGMGHGGRGPEAIALSIAAQLQAWRHSADV